MSGDSKKRTRVTGLASGGGWAVPRGDIFTSSECWCSTGDGTPHGGACSEGAPPFGGVSFEEGRPAPATDAAAAKELPHSRASIFVEPLPHTNGGLSAKPSIEAPESSNSHASRVIPRSSGPCEVAGSSSLPRRAPSDEPSVPPEHPSTRSSFPTIGVVDASTPLIGWPPGKRSSPPTPSASSGG